MAYADNTKVPTSKSIQDIEKIILRFGADGFMYGWQKDERDNHIAAISFRYENRQIRFHLPIGKAEDHLMTPRMHRRTERQAEEFFHKDVNRRWRSLLLIIKAKLVAIQDGITTFDNEFLAFMVLPNGRTAGDWLVPQLDEAMEQGIMPELVPGLNIKKAIAMGQGKIVDCEVE